MQIVDKLFIHFINIHPIALSALATWMCDMDGEWFPKPDLELCVSTETLRVKEKVCIVLFVLAVSMSLLSNKFFFQFIWS